jgi:DNA-directed RNA polymerase subunit RPC12/RpoP
VEKVFCQVREVGVTSVVVCSRCGGLLLAKIEQRTRTCPYCGSTVILERAKKLASANTTFEASTLLQRLKEEAASRR